MTQNDQKIEHQEAQLCLKCKEMYGHSSFDNLCSQCYKYFLIKLRKEKKLQEVIEKPKQKEQKPILELKQDTKQITSADHPKRPAPVQDQKQISKGRCSKCNKKTGMLGYSCKHCTHEYCKLHRLPEEHSCEVDFITLGKKQIKTDNPSITTRKIEQI